MKLVILLFYYLWIGVQSQTLDELNMEAIALAKENNKIAEELVKTYDKIQEAEDEILMINGNATETLNQNRDLEKKMMDVTYNLTICEIDKNKIQGEKENIERLERRVDEVKEEEKRHRSELKALEDEQTNHPAKLDALNRELNETQSNSKLQELELHELRLKLGKCTEETKYCKNTGKDGGGFINKVVTSTLDGVKQLKKGVANVLRNKINFLKFDVPQ